MKLSCRFSCYLFLATILTAGATAYADTFTFQLNAGTITGSGSLNAVPDASVAGVFDITSMWGTIDSESFSLLGCATYSYSAPCTGTGAAVGLRYDNLLYPDGDSMFYAGAPVQLDDEGIVLQLSDGADASLYASSSHFVTFYINGEPGETAQTGSFVVTATPEPNSFVLLGSGLLGVASGIRRRVKR